MSTIAPAELDQMRTRHVASDPDDVGDVWCDDYQCHQPWPCDASRLIALVDAQTKGRGCPECHAPSWSRYADARRVIEEVESLGESHETSAGAPAAALLAEVKSILAGRLR